MSRTIFRIIELTSQELARERDRPSNSLASCTKRWSAPEPSGHEYVGSATLPEWKRDLHVHGVKRLVREARLLALALPCSGDDVIDLGSEERE